jgi:hypothetical protein
VLLIQACKGEGSGLHSARFRLSGLVMESDRTVLLRFGRFQALLLNSRHLDPSGQRRPIPLHPTNFLTKYGNSIRACLVFIREQYPWKPLTITGCSSAASVAASLTCRTVRMGRIPPRVDIYRTAAVHIRGAAGFNSNASSARGRSSHVYLMRRPASNTSLPCDLARRIPDRLYGTMATGTWSRLRRGS